MSSTLSDLSEIQFLHPSSISKHLECPICQIYFSNPFRLNCGHTFCKHCIEGLKKSLKPFQSLTCPTCRESIDIRYVSADLIAHNLINEQIVFCLHKRNYCGWKGQLSSLVKHLMECTFKDLDTARQQLFEKLDQGIKYAIQRLPKKRYYEKIVEKGKETRFQSGITCYYYQNIEDEKLQENINKNVGESLLVRLLNKDRAMAQDITKHMSQAERNDLKLNSSSIKSTSQESDDISNCIIELKEELLDQENHSKNNEDDCIHEIISVGETKSEADETDENQNNCNKSKNTNIGKCLNTDKNQKRNAISRTKTQHQQRKQIILEKNQSTLDSFFRIKQDQNTNNSNSNCNLLKNNTNNKEHNIDNDDSSKKNEKQSKSRETGKRRMIKSTLPMLVAPLAQFRQFVAKEYDDDEDEEGLIVI